MGKFGRALAGGIAGMAGAAGEVFDDQSKAKEYDRRAAILAKRDKTLAVFRQGLTLERDKTLAAQQVDVRDESRAYAETSEQSGKVLDGMPLSKRQLTQLSDEDIGRTLSMEDYKAGEKASAWEDEKTELDYRQAGNLELQQARNESRSIAKPDKISAADKKLAQANAKAGIESKLSSYDPFFNPTTKAYELNVAGKDKKELDAILTYIDSKGFQFNGSQPDEDTLVISLGEFNYDRYQKSLNPLTKPDYTEVDLNTKEKQSTFDQLKAALDQQNARSNMNDEQGNFRLKRTGSIAAPNQP